MKTTQRTLQQVEAMHAKAVRFAENVLQDGDLADELDSLSTEEYADRKGVRIMTNPKKERSESMALPTRAALKKENDRLRKENEELNEKLDAISDLAAVESDDDYEEEDEDDED